jgi:uncharacterized protein (TIGR02246 family)
MDDRTAIRKALEGLNAAWQTASHDEVAAKVASYFSEGAVVVGPGLARLARGREEISRSYQEFLTNAVVLSVDLEAPDIDLCGDVAVATLKWRMRYRFNEAESSETGYDIYVFAREAGGWTIVWRKLESYPA